MTQVTSSLERAGTFDRRSRGNAAAWQPEDVAGPVQSRRDSKSQDFGAMARQLASDGQWADRVLSPSTPSATSSRPTTEIYEVEGQSRPRQERTEYPDEADPPPAYSDVPRVHELPAEPARQADPVGAAPAELATNTPTRHRDSSSSSSSNSSDENSRSPLLHRRQSRRHHRRDRNSCSRGSWSKKRHSRHHICKALCFSISSLALILLLVFQISATKSHTWFGRPLPGSPKPTLLPDERRFSRHESTGNIEGVFKLYDYLDLSTVTGAIDVVIEPQAGTDPAILKLSSVSGSITVHVATSFLEKSSRPIRTFRTFIKTTSGPISGDIVLGSGGLVKVSTDIGLVFLTIWTTNVAEDNKTSTIVTKSTTGDQSIQVVPLEYDDSVSAIVGDHQTQGTGLLDVTYPQQWRGKVHAVVHGSAAVTVSGSDLNYIRADDKETMAFRGPLTDAKVVNLISHGTGSIDFRC